MKSKNYIQKIRIFKQKKSCGNPQDFIKLSNHKGLQTFATTRKYLSELERNLCCNVNLTNNRINKVA